MSSEEDEESIESVPVNKDTVPTKEVASIKRRVIWQKKEFDNLILQGYMIIPQLTKQAQRT